MDQLYRKNTVYLGSDYGGWEIPDVLTASSICYCFGAGTDVSFELGLIGRFGCKVWTFDPTPGSIDYCKQINDPDFIFSPVGIAKEKGVGRFYKPANPAHISHSLVNLQNTTDYIEVELNTLRGCMEANGHSKIDLLKLDIEGTEYDIINDILEVRPTILCLECHKAPIDFSSFYTLISQRDKDFTWHVNTA